MTHENGAPYIPELIREARGLNGDEKVFLYGLRSHQAHEEFGTRSKLMARTGLSERKLRRVVPVLNRLGLVTSQERPGETTKHILHVAELSSFSQKSRREPDASIALVKRYRMKVASTVATSAVSVPSRPLRSRGAVQGGSAGHAQGEPRKKNLRKEEPETIKNLKTETGDRALDASTTSAHRRIESNRRFGHRLGTMAISDVWVDDYLAGRAIK